MYLNGKGKSCIWYKKAHPALHHQQIAIAPCSFPIPHPKRRALSAQRMYHIACIVVTSCFSVVLLFENVVVLVQTQGTSYTLYIVHGAYTYLKQRNRMTLEGGMKGECNTQLCTLGASGFTYYFANINKWLLVVYKFFTSGTVNLLVYFRENDMLVKKKIVCKNCFANSVQSRAVGD